MKELTLASGRSSVISVGLSFVLFDSLLVIVPCHLFFVSLK